MKRALSMFLLIFCIIEGTTGQETKGKIIDGSTAEPLPFANIVLLNQSDSSFVSGTVTDDNGEFTLIKKRDKELIRISYLGYKTKDTIINGSTNIIRLMPDDNMLGVVEVKAARKIFKMENGGITTDVINSPLSKIGNASDVLEKLPFVVKDGKAISVVGKGSPLIYINNRLVRDLQDLEDLSSTDIKEISVITSPGAEYDATVSSVIRIKTIRRTGNKLSGNVFSNHIFTRKYSNEEGAGLNYRTGKLDLFGSFRYGDYRRMIKMDSEQSLKMEDKTIFMTDINTQESKIKNYHMEEGFNFTINPENEIGAKYMFGKSPGMRFHVESASEAHKNKELYENFTTILNFYGEADNHLVNAYYVGKLASWLKVQWDMDYFTSNSIQNIITEMERSQEEIVDTQSTADNELYAGKLTLKTPVWGNDIIYGGEFSHTKNEQVYLVNRSDGTENLKSNSNTSKQDKFAAFLSYSKGLQKWTFNAGVRFENVKFDYYENKEFMQEQSRLYRNLFPNASVSYQGERLKTMLSYRSTTSRPGYYDLRNTVQFDNPYMYETGNPYLKPTNINDLTASVMWKNIQLMASYKWYKDMIVWVTERYEDTQAIVLSPKNLSDIAKNVTISGNYSPHFGIWNPSLGATLCKDFIYYNDTKYNDPYVSIQFHNNLKLPKDFLFMVSFSGSTAGNRSINYIEGRHRLNIAVNKTLLKEKLIVNLRASDILRKDLNGISREIGDVYYRMNKDEDRREIRLSVRYQFNSTSSKYKGKNAAADELQRL